MALPWCRRRRFWHATHNCVAPYVDIILHRGRFWAKSAASGSVRWWCFRSCWMVLSHVMPRRPSCLLQSAGAEANRILLASALLSRHISIYCHSIVKRNKPIIGTSGLWDKGMKPVGVLFIRPYLVEHSSSSAMALITDTRTVQVFA